MCTDHPERLDDLAAIYAGTSQAVEMSRHLGATLRPLDIDVYAGSISGAYYDSERSAIVIGEQYAAYDNGNRPMNREWHEVFHALMADSLQMPPKTCNPWENHLGWENCATSDSWAEGWAEFWGTVLADRLSWPEPEVYRMGDDKTQGGVSLEYNWSVWDRACDRPWCPSREEFAVASLLRDLYDPVQPSEDDYVMINLAALWQVLGHSTTANRLRDIARRL